MTDLVSDQDTPAAACWSQPYRSGPTRRDRVRVDLLGTRPGLPGHPHQKPREDLPLADLRFTQDETQDTVIEVAAGSSKKADWIPTFVDYLYLSTTNSSAFSPDRHHAPDQPHQNSWAFKRQRP